MKSSPRMKKSVKAFFDTMPETDECIIWPFSKTPAGYPKITINSRSRLLHRVICEEQHGPPLSVNYHAAHSCGNPSCVNKRHLSWKTPKQNCADKLKHGTQHRGENVYNASMSNEVARKIKFDQRRNRVIANHYGVREDVVCNIKRGKSYSHV